MQNQTEPPTLPFNFTLTLTLISAPKTKKLMLGICHIMGVFVNPLERALLLCFTCFSNLNRPTTHSVLQILRSTLRVALFLDS